MDIKVFIDNEDAKRFHGIISRVGFGAKYGTTCCGVFGWRLPATVLAILLVASSAPAADTARPLTAIQPATTRPAAAMHPAVAVPVIKVDNPDHDFGTTWGSGILKHEYTITNAGNADLKITRVNPGCSCTVTGSYPKVLKPGTSGKFPFSLNTHRIHGRYDRSPIIYSNDPKTPALRLKMRGECKRYVEVRPSYAAFGTLVGNEPRKRVLEITNNTEKPLELTLQSPATRPAKRVTVTFELVEKKPGQAFELHVTAVPPYPPGSFSETATLVTNVDAEKKVSVSAYGRVPDPIDIYPKIVSIYQDGSGTISEHQRYLTLSNYTDSAVKILEATVDDPALKVQVTERKAGKNYSIQLSIPAGYDPPDVRTLVVKTDSAQTPVIKVPVRVYPPHKTADTKRIESPLKPKDQTQTRPAQTTQTRPAHTTQMKPAPRTQMRPAYTMLNHKAPSFKLTTLVGKPLSHADLKDSITVMNFIAPNCGYCRRQVPDVEKVRSEYAKKGIRFVNINQTMRRTYSNEEAAKAWESVGSHLELTLDAGNKVGQLFKVTSFPTMMVVDKTGTIKYVNIGSGGASSLRAQLDGLLSGKPIPADNPSPSTAQKAPTRKRPVLDMVDKKSPSFRLATLAGKTVSDAGLKGIITVLNFVAPNCGYCRRQIPEVEKVRSEYAKKGIRFVNINQTMRKPYTNEEAAKAWESVGSHLELAPDPGNKVGGLFKVTGFPTMMVVDKTGTIKYVNIGSGGGSSLRTQLDGLLGGKAATSSPAAAAGHGTLRSKS